MEDLEAIFADCVECADRKKVTTCLTSGLFHSNDQDSGFFCGDDLDLLTRLSLRGSSEGCSETEEVQLAGVGCLSALH